MTTHTPNPAIKAELDALLLAIPGVEPAQMFGHPGYAVDGKMFAFLLERGVAIKLPKSTVQSMLGPATFAMFEPGDSGRVWQEWLCIYRDADAYAQDAPLFRQSVDYVTGQASAKSKKRR